MKILIASAATSWMPGGVPAETRDLIRGLVQRGHEVALACDVPLSGAEAARHFAITLPIGGPSSGRELRSAIDAFEPDFVHVICMGAKGMISSLPVLRGRRWALTVHSVPPSEQKLHRWHAHEGLHYAARSIRFLPNSVAWRWLFRRGGIPRVVVHSDYVRGIVTRFGFAGQRVELVPLPFHPRATPAEGRIRASRGADGPRFVTVGGMAHTKGQHDAIKALPALLKRFPGLTYQLIGEARDDSYVQWLKTLAAELGVADRVLITPNLTQEAKGEALSRADVYIQPSHEEGFCLAYAEAAAVVDRLVGTDAGAIAAMSRDDPGARVVPVRAPQAIADAVADLLDSKLLDTHMADRVARLSTRFSYDEYLRAHEALYTA
jgi:glycosyltransferase involved in cell wall biosynthesis